MADRDSSERREIDRGKEERKREVGREKQSCFEAERLRHLNCLQNMKARRNFRLLIRLLTGTNPPAKGANLNAVSKNHFPVSG